MPAAEKELVDRYLTEYKNGDLDGMYACLDSNFTFSDPAFPNLDAHHGKGMLAMFLKNRHINKMELTYTPIEGDGPEYTSTYTVKYLFDSRHVTNVIHTTIAVSPATGLITKQVDTFDFWTWSKQSLGLPGLLLGWTSYLQGTVQARAAGKLEQFLQKEEAKATSTA